MAFLQNELPLSLSLSLFAVFFNKWNSLTLPPIVHIYVGPSSFIILFLQFTISSSTVSILPNDVTRTFFL